MSFGKKSLKYTCYVFAKCVILGLFLVITIFPFYWIAITSLKPQRDIFEIPVYYFPKTLSIENYKLLFSNMKFGVFILNSVMVSLVAAFFAVVFAIMGAYILSRFRFSGKRVIMYYFLVTQMLPSFIGLASLYKMLSAWGMIDFLPTLMILNASWLIPYSTITMKGFLQRVSRSLEESAEIDGCGKIRALVFVVLPVILPGIAAVYIFAFVQSWNDLFSPVLFMNREMHYTIPVALNAMVLKNDVRWGELSAGTVIAILPTVIMFAFAQRYIAAGLMAGALKE